jgi:hypothetical protein
MLAAPLPLAALVLLATASPAPAPDPALARALAAIRPAAIRAHVTFLADDRLQGRGTGTAGYQRAADYVAAQFRQIGLEQGVHDTSYFQKVPFRRGQVVERECTLSLAGNDGHERRFEYGRDYVMSPDYRRDEMMAANRAVFVGYGVSAPELHWDDYQGLDARGRVVVMLAGAPHGFPNDQRAYYSWNQGKERNAAAHGARGIITIRKPDDELRTTWERVLRQSRLPGLRWIGSDAEPHDTFEGLHLGATLNHAAAETLFRAAGTRLDTVLAQTEAGRPPRFALPFQVHARRVTVLTPASSPNVVGLLRGSDPALRDQYVVFSAHLDHLGISTPVKGDSINNGAYDNASGVAMIVEIARAFAAMKPRPRRSILFLAVTGEEKGLQGSDYFAHFPTVPVSQIVADVNLDMFLMLHPAKSVVVYGAEHSSLGPVAEAAARSLGMSLAPDPHPEEVIFVRSDQFSFIRAGVPSLFPTASAADSPADSAAQVAWMRTIYHTPQDDLHQSFDWEAGARCARLGFLIGDAVANQPARPAWNAGDYFGETFGTRAP